MFLIIVLFGLLALGLAFVMYLQGDVTQNMPVKAPPAAIVAPAAPVAATPEPVQAPLATPDSTTSTASSSAANPTQPDSTDGLSAALKEAEAALTKAAEDGKKAEPSPQP
jgi:hypothetical protein